MEPNPQLLERDRLLRDNFTPAEGMLFGLILVTANVCFWIGEPRSSWVHGFFLIPGALSIVLLKIHEHTHPFFIRFLWPKFWFYSAPVWLLLIQFAVGLLQRPLQPLTLEGTEFIQLKVPENVWLPVTTSAEAASLIVLGFGALYIVAMGLFIVPKSRVFFERLMPYLCLSASLVALFGYIQTALNASRPFLTRGTGASDFFAFFPYDGHWAAFATLWTCACVSMALLTSRYEENPVFIQSSGPWYLTGGALLGASAFMVEARWPAIVLMLTYGCMMLIASINFFAESRDPNRKSISLITGLISLVMFGAGIHRFVLAESGGAGSEALHQTARDMFGESPVFGWGFDSFGHLLPFYGDDLLLANHYERAGSDILQLLAEIGLMGMLPSIALLIFLVFRYLRGRHNMRLSNHLLIGLAATLILAFLDSPFMSPAVFLSFCTLLFVALRWADVTRNKADEVDAHRPRLVTPAPLRSVPFHTESKQRNL